MFVGQSSAVFRARSKEWGGIDRYQHPTVKAQQPFVEETCWRVVYVHSNVHGKPQIGVRFPSTLASLRASARSGQASFGESCGRTYPRDDVSETVLLFVCFGPVMAFRL